MPKINQEEYEILKNLDDKWKWIARDLEGELYTFVIEPFKNYWFNHWRNGTCDLVRFENSLFQFIQWEDDEPHNIQELIEEYEENLANEIINRQFESLFGESEETEVKKDIEWLEERVSSKIKSAELNVMAHREGLSEDFESRVIAYESVLKDINQLDKPETLSQDWIDGKKIGVRNRIPFHMDVDYAVPEEDLQNLLVPKQEITYEDALKVIAENIDTDEFSIGMFLEALSNNEKYEFLTEKWIEDNTSPVDEEGRLYVWKRDLQNVIVPKQEEITEEQITEYLRERSMTAVDSALVYRENLDNKIVIEKPTIPQFIADYLPLVKEDIELEEASYYAVTDNELPKWKREYDWIRENFETFVKAWLAYPNIEVEEEQKYSRVLKVGEMYFLGGGDDSQGNFVVELTDNRRLAHVFDDEEEANNMQNEIGGEVEELEE